MTTSRPVAGAPARGRLAHLGRWCARNPWPVVVIWLLVVVGATVANQAAGGTYSDDFNLSSTESGQGSTALSDHGVAVGANTSRLVYSTDDGTLADQRTAIEKTIDQVKGVAHVVSASDPLTDSTTSPDGKVAYSTIRFDGNPATIGGSLVDDVNRATDAARDVKVSVS